MTTIAPILLLAFVYVMLVEFVRALNWSDHLKKRKPLSCDACMVSWAVLLDQLWRSAVVKADVDFALTVAAGGLALLLLGALKHWRGLSLSPPE